MPPEPTGSLLTQLECSKTGETYGADTLQNLSRVGAPLLVRYDFGRTKLSPGDLANGPVSLWRYAPVLPVRNTASIVDLGEGWTPRLPVERIRTRLRMSRLFVKDES